MSVRNFYYEAEENLLKEIKRDRRFSFRTIIKLFTAGAIAKKL
ncbi:MAG: hypothetical protein PUB20_05865 [Clostridia bacterium]|nr:hypothetical protein [Clostridia bacterium]